MWLSPEALKTDPKLWSRYRGLLPPENSPRLPEIVPEIVPIAYDFLSNTNLVETSEHDPDSSLLIVGALNALAYHVNAFPDDAFMTCRRIGTYFSSRNINLAFAAIGWFEIPHLRQYSIFVSDQLVAVASCETPTPSPIEMTVRGLAFRVLFKIDQGFRFWSCLRSARDECVHGLLTWGGQNERNRSLARMILRYT